MRAAVVPLSLLLLVSACGGGDNKGTNAAPSPSSTSASPSRPSSSPSSAASPDPATGGDGAAGAVCTFLQAEAPKLTTGTSVGNLAALAIALATFVGDHPEARFDSTSELDQITTTHCPAARKAVLAKIGATAFAGAL